MFSLLIDLLSHGLRLLFAVCGVIVFIVSLDYLNYLLANAQAQPLREMSVDRPDDEDVTHAIASEPSFFVDERLLRRESRIGNVPASQIKYRIKDSVFVEDEREETGIVEFEVYEERAEDKIGTKMDHDYDVYCSTPTDTESECEDEDPGNGPLPTTIQAVPHGIIVNSNVYLTNHQWNTLIFMDVKKVQCAVCEVQSELDTCLEHAATERHKKNLDSHKPLEKFDLSVTRKIRNNYHCAVCNELFDASDNYDHFGSKMHEGNLLFAINKASDVMYDYNVHEVADKKDCYHFNENNVNGNRNYENFNEYNDGVSSHSDYINNDHYINFQNNYFYNDFEVDEDIPVHTGASYATMARKPKVVLQQFLDIDLGNKKVKVRFDSWHMIISPKLNRFYCMVCKKLDHMRLKAEHCSEVEHLKNLDKCKVVEAYEEYFIRQVDDRLYHCGHCNNLQIINDMKDHVETNHPKRTKIFTEANPSIISTMKNKNKDNEEHDSNTNNDSPRTPVKGVNSLPAHNQNNGNATPVKSNDNIVQIPQSNIRVSTPVKDYDKTVQISQANDRVSTPVKDYDKTVQIPQNNDKLGPPVKYYDKTIQRPVNNNNGNTNNDRQVTKADNGLVVNANSINDKNRGNATKLPSIVDSIVIFPFGYKLTISMLSYNIVCKRPNDFYCALCDVICPPTVISRHLYEIRHIELLRRTPFIVPFSYHLIRAIREALHCAICNIPVAAVKIYEHISDPQHAKALSKALGVVATPVKSPNTNVKPANVRVTTAPAVKNVLDIKTATTDVKVPPNVTTDVKTATTGVKITPNVVTDVKKSVNDVKISPVNTQTVAQNVAINVTRDYNDNKREFNYNTRDINDKPRDFNVKEAIKEPSLSNEIDINEDLHENLNETIDSVASEDVTFDMEEYVYLKLRNSYIKIANTSYNTLVHVGDGSRYCFVCALQVDYVDLQKHVDSRGHLNNMEMYRFLDKYEDHLLRQIFLMYHCCICNVIITRKELKCHLEWPTHALQNENTMKNIKKTRKNEIKGGVKQIVVSTQKENIYLNEKEPKLKIRFNAEIRDGPNGKNPHKTETPDKTLNAVPDTSKKNKIIILLDNVLKISWEGWHGIAKVKNGYKCNLCQRDLKGNEIEVHCDGEWHRYGLDKPFEKQYAPALIRKITELTLNCLICNTEVSNKDHLVTEHINGKKHIKNYETILKDSSQANTYADCNDDVLML